MSLSAPSSCEHCGAANEEHAITCRFCGHSLQESTDVLSHTGAVALRTNKVLGGRSRIGASVGLRDPKTQRHILCIAGLLTLAIGCLLTGGCSGYLTGTQNATNTNAANQATITNATSTAQANATMGTTLNGTATAIIQTVTTLPDPNTVAGALPAPRQIAPLSGTVFSTYPRKLTLTWNAVSGATSYTVLIYYFQPGETTCTGGTPLSLVVDLTSTSYTFDYIGAQPGCWQVWATNAAGSGHKSPFWEFSFTQ